MTKEPEHYCSCCLSEHCYKDMNNEYYFGNKTENYFEMILNIFTINISNKDGHRCLICEECVTKLRIAAAFKEQVLNAQNAIHKKLYSKENGADIDTNLTVKIENDDFEDFDDHISDRYSDCNFFRDVTPGKKQKGQEFVINLGEKVPNTARRKLSSKSNNEKIKIHEINEKTSEMKRKTDGDTKNTKATKSSRCTTIDGAVTKSSGAPGPRAKRDVITKAGADREKMSEKKCQEISETNIRAIHMRENTMKLIQNSNLILFRSLKNKYGCKLCRASFPGVNLLRVHSQTHSESFAIKIKNLRGLSYKNADISDLKCNVCSEKCLDLSELNNHLKNNHDILFHGSEHFLIPYKLQDGFQCVLCDSKFNSYMRLSIHMNTHYTNSVCETCGQSFINRLGLRSHVQSMHKEKKCSQCPATFITCGARVKHLNKVHNIHPSKQYYCTLCNKVFQYTYKLREHQVQDHGVKRQTYTCVECSKIFLNEINLKVHFRSVHIRERNHPCGRCCMRFFTKCDLKRHEKTHEDVRSFSCSNCEAKFKSKDSWRRHLKKQHGQGLDGVS